MTDFAHLNLRLALLGGEGLRPESTPLWRDLLALGGNAQNIAIIPFALVDLPLSQRERRARITRDRFSELGVEATIWSTDELHAPTLNGTRLIYLPGGDQRSVTSGFAQTGLWQALAADNATERVLIASGGAAVAFGKQIFAPQKPYPSALDGLTFDIVPGLGLLSDIIILPYFSWLQDAIVEQIRSLAPDTTLVGIDDQAAVISHGSGWRVAGLGTVSILRRNQPAAIFDPGNLIPPNVLSPYPQETS